ncbi:hypothetical protein L226DRAFT_272708 [Lentinus tigrinus ALCF2SS1-7]|uniref:uncharacterized protein n=1 Tax=Lentinus tigrinus ALCF2SS1-7 TaxID=1328758 RepID=UPI001165D308|nr:hypothetical protein L226DRAFT_272708 [Lentinus tigrinus ALCF2SS1-7]
MQVYCNSPLTLQRLLPLLTSLFSYILPRWAANQALQSTLAPHARQTYRPQPVPPSGPSDGSLRHAQESSRLGPQTYPTYPQTNGLCNTGYVAINLGLLLDLPHQPEVLTADYPGPTVCLVCQ